MQFVLERDSAAAEPFVRCCVDHIYSIHTKFMRNLDFNMMALKNVD